jgi:hypothetical protein
LVPAFLQPEAEGKTVTRCHNMLLPELHIMDCGVTVGLRLKKAKSVKNRFIGNEQAVDRSYTQKNKLRRTSFYIIAYSDKIKIKKL